MTGSAQRMAVRRRGQPLLVLGSLLLGWIALRAVFWEPIAMPNLAVRLAMPAIVPATPSEPGRPALPPASAAAAVPAHSLVEPTRHAFVVGAPAVVVPPPAEPAPLPQFAPTPAVGEAPKVAGGHLLAWVAGVAQLPMPQFVMEPSARAAPRLRPSRRWSADGWLMLRQGGAEAAFGAVAAPSYGRSQAGAVVRFRLSPTSIHRPVAYLRASSAIEAPRGEELAVGLSVRPLARLPVALVAEVRATNQATGGQLRPAIAAVSELPRLALPLGLSAEAYGQAGVVGGADGTPFADGQLRVERRLARIGQGELRAGLGAWGGAQKGASRIDVGPSATLDFGVGGGHGRLSADWRLRAAGNAAPRSGPAITLSAGF